MFWEAVGRTDVGRKRAHNEDAILVSTGGGLFCVADGMGGHRSGEVASRMALESLTRAFETVSSDPEGQIVSALQRADREIVEAGFADAACYGMGTTAVLLLLSRERAFIAHAGDSRAYRFSKGRLEALTEDHSLLNDYLKSGRLAPEEAAKFPHKNIILRALGGVEPLEVEVSSHAPREGDLYLLCSDGLTGMLSDDQIAARLARPGTLEEKAEGLVAAANEAGGIDNISCILVHVHRSGHADTRE